MKKKFNITGMTCSACSSRIEKVVSKIEEVKKIEVNLLTNSMQVEYDTKETEEKIIKIVQKAGYGAKLAEKGIKQEEETIKKMRERLLISIGFLIPLMYISMGHMVGLPIPSILHSPIIFTIIQLLLLLPIIWVNRSYYIHGFKNLVKRVPNMDSLIAVGSSAAIFYGIYAIIKIIIAVQMQDMQTANYFMMNVYFESAGMIVALITLGKYLEIKAKGKTTEAINKLINLAPKMATVERNGKEERIVSQEIKIGDILIIRPGESIPADGTIIEGETYIDQAAITGESFPIHKKVGDVVMTATINKNGSIKCIAQKIGEDTSLAQIIKLVEEASASKAPIGKLADKISGIFVPIVIAIACIAAFIWIFVGKDIEFALSIAISILVISCPCALGLATPVSIMVGTGKGAEKGILLKSAESLENTHLVNTILLDKTGTITEGKTKVTNEKWKENIKIPYEIIYQIEQKSEHPISNAIVEYLETKRDKEEMKIENFEALSGRGVKATVGKVNYWIGNLKLMQENNMTIQEFEKEYRKDAKEAKTVIFVACENQVIGIFAISDKIKEDSKIAIEELKKIGIEVYMVTGDNKEVAKQVGKQVGIQEENIIAEVLPENKEKIVRKLQEQGKNVAMVGDGINDSPALVRANVGIAIGAGTDIAIEAADIVLIQNSLKEVVVAIKLSKATIKNIKMNLFWAFFYNMIGIPIAAGILYPSLGFTLNPMVAAACMSLSSVSVVLNALRLRKFGKNKEK